MGKISLLSDVLASQVAAGEVVERPASVVKELIENSIDAGAKRIVVEFNDGGIGLLRVTDDGCGMDRSDALLSLERHATSKIKTAEDLAAIATLGFRGEAVPSIASVSRFRLSTRQREEQSSSVSLGTEIEVHGGKVIEVRESGASYGTCIEVKDLFYNVPARRKFLKGEQTEAAHIIQQIQILAVAHPEIAFTCVRDRRELFRLGATESLAVRLSDLYGSAFLQRMMEVPHHDVEGVVVSGFFARPGEGRSDRSQQLLFVNGRMIRSNLVSQALREACDGILAKGLHPQAVLFFQLDPTTIDCNVHPAKREVRFQEPAKIKAAALRAASLVMGNFSQERTFLPPLQEVARPYTIKRGIEYLQPSLAVSESLVEENIMHYQSEDIVNKLRPAFKLAEADEGQGVNNAQKVSLHEEALEASSTGATNSFAASVEFQGRSSFRYIGSLAHRYLILEEDAGLVLLEIRAALERITYDSLYQSLLKGSLQRQPLLLPEVIEVSPAESAWVMAHQSLLEKVGLEVELFGEGSSGAARHSLKIDVIPAAADQIPVAELLHQLINDFQQEESKSSLKQEKKVLAVEEALARSVSRMAAQAKKLPEGEMPAMMLVRDLLRCELPYATPAGRPTMIQLSEVELRRKFKG